MDTWSGEPAYRQVADDLRAGIRNGRLAVDTQLPSLFDLMRQYEVSITVVRMALRDLRAEGLVTTHQGKGTFVRKVPPARADGDASIELRAAEVAIDQVWKYVQRLEARIAELERIVKDTPERREGDARR